MTKRRPTRLFKFMIENPLRFHKEGHASMVMPWLHNFKESESWVRKELRRNNPTHVDVHRVRSDGRIGLSRRYFRDMSYKSF